MKRSGFPAPALSKDRVSCEVNRSGATGVRIFAAYEDYHLRRREDSASSPKLHHEWQRLMLVYRRAHPVLRRERSLQRPSQKAELDPGFAWRRS